MSPGSRSNHPDDPPENFETGRAYGYSKRLEGPAVEGAPIVWCFHLPGGTIEVKNFRLSLATMERALTAAVLREIRWHRSQVSAEGLEQWGEEHWRAFLAEPPIVFLDCVK